MEAANRGACEAGAKTIGLNIKLPFEQDPNPYITPALNFEFHYFFMRKFWFAYLAKALVVFPGGFGTLDEMFELLTLAQTNKLAKTIAVIIYGSRLLEDRPQLRLARRKGAIAAKDLDLFQFADTPEEAFALAAGGPEHPFLSSGPRRAPRSPESPRPAPRSCSDPTSARPGIRHGALSRAPMTFRAQALRASNATTRSKFRTIVRCSHEIVHRCRPKILAGQW